MDVSRTRFLAFIVMTFASLATGATEKFYEGLQRGLMKGCVQSESTAPIYNAFSLDVVTPTCVCVASAVVAEAKRSVLLRDAMNKGNDADTKKILSEIVRAVRASRSRPCFESAIAEAKSNGLIIDPGKVSTRPGLSGPWITPELRVEFIRGCNGDGQVQPRPVNCECAFDRFVAIVSEADVVSAYRDDAGRDAVLRKVAEAVGSGC